MSSKNRTMALYCLWNGHNNFHPRAKMPCPLEKTAVYVQRRVAEGRRCVGRAAEAVFPYEREFWPSSPRPLRCHTICTVETGGEKHTSIYTQRRKLLHLSTRLNHHSFSMCDACIGTLSMGFLQLSSRDWQQSGEEPHL